MKTCRVCSTPIPSPKGPQAYCSNECRPASLVRLHEQQRVARALRPIPQCRECHVALPGRRSDRRRCDQCQRVAYNTGARSRYHASPTDQKRRQNVWNERHPGLRNERGRARHRLLRLATFEAYGGAKCACCGEGTHEFLGIDHLNDNGAEERRQGFASGGAAFYRRLQKLGYPPGYQILCHNCNMAKGFYGQCPHTNEGETR